MPSLIWWPERMRSQRLFSGFPHLRLLLGFLIAVWGAWPGGARGAAAEFDSRRAFELLREQCRFGPRAPGSDGHTRCLAWITSQCKALDLVTTHQTFSAYLPLIRKTVRLTNIVAVHQPRNRRKIMLSTHCDTRPMADWDTTPARRKMPILGANDGASGVAVLLELARIFRQNPPSVGVIFAFFDGEDSGERGREGFCIGSQYMADNLPPAWRFENGINLDMVGDRDLSIPIEGNSWAKARSLALTLWGVGAQLYPKTFRLEPGIEIYDDHVPFLDHKLPYVDVIDFDYPYWHTLEDTEDKCSAQSLEKVGRVIARFVLSQ